MLFKIGATDAVFIVDPQGCFMERGQLPVIGGRALIPVWQELLAKFKPIQRFASRDMHMPGSISLASSYVGIAPCTLMTKSLVETRVAEEVRGVRRFLIPDARFAFLDVVEYLKEGDYMVWPDHGLEGDPMTAIVYPIDKMIGLSKIFLKGYANPARDSYSAFTDGAGKPSRATRDLNNYGIERIVMAGLAEDYCVASSAIDAANRGFEVYVVTDAIAAVDPNSENCAAMRKGMKDVGVKFITLADIQG
jgi:nicotinamidase/pyrazinamidase